jgi:hypothetical protein
MDVKALQKFKGQKPKACLCAPPLASSLAAPNPAAPPAPAALVPGASPVPAELAAQQPAPMAPAEVAILWFSLYSAPFRREVFLASYKTNDLVEIVGALGKKDRRCVRINGLPPFKVDRLELLVLFVLACAALTRAGLLAPYCVSADEFLPWHRIAEEIVALEKRVPALREAFYDVTYQSVARAVSTLRKKIAKRKGNRFLIETGETVEGYRLSTHPANLRLLVREFNATGPAEHPLASAVPR